MTDNSNIDNPSIVDRSTGTATDAIQDKKRKGCFSRSGCIVMTLLLMFFFMYMFRAAQEGRSIAKRMQCVPKQIALALHNYHDIFGTFPPAYTTDANGRPLHSWRVLILPFLEHQKLYEKIRLDEPWDSLHNSQFHNTIPDDYFCQIPGNYFCPGRPKEEKTKGLTPYQMIIGPDTISNGPNCTKLSDVTRDKGDAILFVETTISVPWMKPDDLPQPFLEFGIRSSIPTRLIPVVRAIGSPHYTHPQTDHPLVTPFATRIAGAHVVMVDTSCEFFTKDMSSEDLLEKSRIRNPE